MTDDAPSIGLADPEVVAHMTGLEIVEAMGTGALPMPPIAGVMPIDPVSCAEGSVEFRATPEARFYNPMGTVHGGWMMTMLDTAMGVAALTTLAKGQTYTSIDTSVRFIRPLFETSGEMRIAGRVVSRGRTVITVDGLIEDGKGRTVATGTSSCLIIHPRRRGPEA